MPPAQTPAPERAIEHVRGQLFQLQDGPRATVFLGILLADPLSAATARWLKDELPARFPGRAVRYVVHSHHALGRSRGGAVFKPDAAIAGHERFNSAVYREGPGCEVGYVTEPYVTGTTINIGSQTVVVVNPGGEYRPDTPALFFPNERVLFSAAHPAVSMRPFSAAGHNLKEVMAWMRSVAPLDFDILVSGRGEQVSRADFDALAAYLEDLLADVVAGYRSRLSVDEIQSLPALARHGGNRHDAGRRAIIAGMYDALHVVQTDVYAAAALKWFSTNGSYCSSFDSCESGGVIPAGTVGVRMSAGRYGALAELALGAQFTSRRDSALFDDVFAHRSSRGSLLLRHGGKHRAGTSYDLLAGASLTVGDSRGIARVKGGFAPFAGRRPIAERTTKLGLTLGADISTPVVHHLRIVVPVRVTVAGEPRSLASEPSVPGNRWPGRWDLHVGVGFSFGVQQRVR